MDAGNLRRKKVIFSSDETNSSQRADGDGGTMVLTDIVHVAVYRVDIETSRNLFSASVPLEVQAHEFFSRQFFSREDASLFLLSFDRSFSVC